MHSIHQRSGFSIVEIVAATLIFTIAAVGLFSTFAAQREAGERSERRLQAAYLARQVLDELRAKIDPANWSAGYLQEGTHAYPTNNPLFNAAYTVTNSTTGGRKVTLNIIWNEP